MFSFDHKGIKINAADLWLDAHRKVDFSFISHGHSDHLKNHPKILATPATARFHQLRSKKSDLQILNYRETLELEDLTIRLYPAGHVLGSAMIYLERDGRSLLYSGDFKMQPSLTAEPIEIPHADILIMESTYGDPQYVVDRSRDSLVAELNEVVHDCFKRGNTPVVMAYSLGKAQEAMKILGDQGFTVRVHRSAWEMAQVYQDFGVPFRNCSLWHEQPMSPEEVLIASPHVCRTRALYDLNRPYTIFLSGWANGNNPIGRSANHAIPLSDHADFNELIHFAHRVNPDIIYTTHGYAGFPRHLCEHGFTAQLLGE